MALIERGKVQNGGIVFLEPLPLPDGIEVIVHIEAMLGRGTAAPESGEEFASLPCFGMWKDREDMADSVAWVRKEREKWHQRVKRKD